MGLGLSTVASTPGAEGVWWNPSLIARSPKELLIGNVSGMPPAESDLSLVGVYSMPRVVSIALSGRYISYGASEATIDPSNPTGSYLNAAYLLAATFGAPFGDRFAAGTTLKLLAISFDCTGTCPMQPQNTPVTGAVDLGVQYILRRDSLVTVGAAIRNLGLPLFFNDSPQADALPGRVDLGVEIAPRLTQYPGLGVRVSAAMVERIVNEAGPGFRVGAEASWLNQYFGRVGYIKDGPTGTGPTIGGGVSRGRWRVDFAQFLSDVSAIVGEKPTYFSLRYTF